MRRAGCGFYAGPVPPGKPPEVLGFKNGANHLGARNGMLMLNLTPIVVFDIDAWLGSRFSTIELGDAVLVIGASVANNLFLRKSSRF